MEDTDIAIEAEAIDNPVDGAEDFETEGYEHEDSTEGQDAPEVPKYTVKVDGADVEVTLDELTNGYSRQADYTRKTQALAAEREQLATYQALAKALETDPQGTLEVLRTMYGAPSATSVPEVLDPLEREVNELKQFRASVEAERRQTQIQAEISSVFSRYGDTETTSEQLLQFAINHGINSVEAAYKALSFDRSRTQAAEAKQQETARKTDKKRTAPPILGGSGRAPASAQPGNNSKMSFAEAWRAAKQELGA